LPRRFAPRSDGPRRAALGFTLIELLVVVAVLSTVAVAAFGLMSEDRAQVRIDDTRNRLTLLRRAVVGVEAPAYGGQMRLSGYVADNGRLPGSLSDLISDGGALFPQQGVTPGLSATVDDECFQTGTPPDNLGHAARVLKGYRGNYLAGATPNGFFRDGWGNVGTTPPLASPEDPHDESRNFGWWVKNEGDTLTIKSLGADNAVDDTPPALEAEVDQPITIDKADWRIPLDGWQVRLANSSDANLAIADIDDNSIVGGFSNLGVTLLVFENVDTVGASGKWRQYRSTYNTCNTSTPSLSPEGVCVFLFVADEDGKIPCGASGKTPADVPLGRHILVLTANHGLPSVRQFVTPVDFYPGAIPPEITWNVRNNKEED
jgi:prepilin-type N-terminal cleavage/methylation domain-containing protein